VGFYSEAVPTKPQFHKKKGLLSLPPYYPESAHKSYRVAHHNSEGHFQYWGRIGERVSVLLRRWAFTFKGISAAFAEFERDILRERVKAGIAQAHTQGHSHRRPATAAKKAAEVKKLFKRGMNKSEIARKV